MTLTGLAQEMATEFGEQYGDLDIADQFKKWTQQAYEELVSQARWLFRNNRRTVPLVADTATYTLNADVSQVRTAYLTNGSDSVQQGVAYCTVEGLRARGEALGEAGTPEAWFYYGWDSSAQALKIQLFPVPNSAAVAAWPSLVLETVERPVTLAASDTIPLPLECINLLRDNIRYRVKMNDGDIEAAKGFRTLYNDGLGSFNSQYMGAEEGGSSLRIKRQKRVRQAPSATEEG